MSNCFLLKVHCIALLTYSILKKQLCTSINELYKISVKVKISFSYFIIKLLIRRSNIKQTNDAVKCKLN